MQILYKDRKYETDLDMEGFYITETTIKELEKLGHIKLISN